MSSVQRHMITTLLMFLVVILHAGTGISYAQADGVVFGPKVYVKSKTGTVTYADRFETRHGHYVLRLQNGEAGKKDAEYVSVRINGKQVIDSRDLKKANPSTKRIHLGKRNTIEVLLKGKIGTFITLEITTKPLAVVIDSPQESEVIYGPSVLVRGTVNNRDGAEIGVRVNGVAASVYGNLFVANNVKLVEGANKIQALARDTAHHKAKGSVTVTATTTGGWVVMSSDIQSGVAPLTVNFSASFSGFRAESFEMDFDGDGMADYTGATFDGISRIYPSEGIYFPKVKVADSQGNLYSYSMAIIVYSPNAVDVLLKNKWQGMKNAMISRNVEEVMSYFLTTSQDKYRKAFASIVDFLPDVAASMQEIQMIAVKNGVAEYRVKRTGDASGATFYIYFAQDEDGIWKIQQF
jgi:hypothetical protein